MTESLCAFNVNVVVKLDFGSDYSTSTIRKQRRPPMAERRRQRTACQGPSNSKHWLWSGSKTYNVVPAKADLTAAGRDVVPTRKHGDFRR